MWKRVASATGVAVTLALAVLAGTTITAGASPNQGVTSTTIRIGVPYIDFSALAAQGVKLTQGNFPDAYGAIIAYDNAHGGINGRKIVAYYEPVNLSDGTVGVNAVCTTLTQNDSIFAAMAPYEPNCYVVNHATPTVGATFEGAAPTTSTPNFTLTAPSNAYDPLQLAAYDKAGLFKGKKVGVMGGETLDQGQLNTDVAVLKRLHVNVVQTAVNSAPAGDQTALVAQDNVIIQKFKNAGVDEVVAVGAGSSGWPYGLAQLQSSYNPPWIALDATTLTGSLAGTTGETQYLKTVTTSTPGLTSIQAWQDPLIQKCVSIIKKAYPSDPIAEPSATNSQDHSYIAPESACENMALFSDIAKAAGKKLTVASFTKAGYGLRNITLPGAGGPVSFGPGRDYALGTVFIGKYNPALNQIVYATKSAAS